jgi:hypothetical protein
MSKYETNIRVITHLLMQYQSVQCLTTDWTTGVRSLTEAKYFSSSLRVQTDPEAHPASYPFWYRRSYPQG